MFRGRATVIAHVRRHPAKAPNQPDGSPTDALSEVGIKQTTVMGTELAGVHLRIVCTSPKLRAREAGQLIADAMGDVPDFGFRTVPGLDYVHGLPEGVPERDLVAVMKKIDTKEYPDDNGLHPNVADLLAEFPEGYGYMVRWRAAVEGVVREIHHEHVGDGEDHILIVTHSPVMELGIGDVDVPFGGEGDGYDLMFEVEGDEVKLVGTDFVPCLRVDQTRG